MITHRNFAKRGSGSIDPKGYRRISVNGKGMMEHRFVMGQVLGRSLFPNETVHHKDGNRLNNHPSNLEVWIVSQPCGQRIMDKLEYSYKILEKYGESNTKVMCDRPSIKKEQLVLTIKDQRCESRGVQLLWDTLSELGSATTTELKSVLKVALCNITVPLRLHPELFEKIQRLPQDDRRSFRWQVRKDSKRPEPALRGSITEEGYRSYSRGNGRHYLEHRLVMEQYLGRKLLAKENVHHKDGDRLNNDILNLELWSTSQPSGQRIHDLLKWAHEIIQLYGQPETPKAIDQEKQVPTRYERPWVI